MPDHDFHLDLDDMRFALFQATPVDQLLACEVNKDSDRDSLSMLIDEAARFNKEQVAPLDGPADKAGATFNAGVVTMPSGFEAVYKKICDGGWLSLTAPEQYGGMALPYIMQVLIGEMQVGACCSMSIGFGLTEAAAHAIEVCGNETMQKTYLDKLYSGEWQGTMCLTEPGAGSAVGDAITTAKPAGATDEGMGDRWLIEGTKIFISFGEHDMTDNHIHLVLARTPGAPKGAKGISLFLVPKHRLNADRSIGEFNNVHCAGIEHKMGIHASPTCVMKFGEGGPSYGWMIGEENKGLKGMFHMMNRARIGVGIQGVGLGTQAHLYAQSYAHEREQGVDIRNIRDANAPRVKIIEHPDVRRMVLWNKAIVEGSRALLYRAAFYHDMAEHGPEDKRERYKGMLDFLTPICKSYISDRAFDVTNNAIQIMGGYGYIAEYPVERFMRDSKIASLYEGTNGIQALDLVGRKLGKKKGAYFQWLLEEMEGFAKRLASHPVLASEIKIFKKQLDRWSDITLNIAQRGMQGEVLYPVLHSLNYLNATGHVVLAWLLSEQACIAADQLQGMFIDKSLLDKEAQRALIAENREAKYLNNKIETTRFFLNQILPEIEAIQSRLTSGDTSALDFVA